jgi:cell division protein ZipA
MPELRWILIAAGVLLLAGIWWWEWRRRSDEADHFSEDSRSEEEPGRSEPTLGEETAVEAGGTADELPPIRASRRERPRELPVVEFPEDTEPELGKSPVREEVPIRVPYRAMQQHLDERPQDLEGLSSGGEPNREEREPWLRTQPLERNKLFDGGREPAAPSLEPDFEEDDELAAEDAPATAGSAGEEAGVEAETAAEPEAEAETSGETSIPQRQKIVALRLVCKDERWSGDAVIDALESEGLHFGKYSIFHRERDDGKSIFYVASMIEPGSFDREGMPSMSFPGISIFAVVPGPVDGGTTFDMMLATARRLAQRLSGQLQDEQGSSLTAQRVLNLREEVVHFEHVIRRLRAP